MSLDDINFAVNALSDQITLIKKDLGLTPGGVYANTRVRLDVLEARINNPLAPAPSVNNPFIIGNGAVTISTGTGAPTENRVNGSIYLREDGYNYQGVYSRKDGYWTLLNAIEPAIVFDTTSAKTNLVSARLNSLIDNTKLGINNFGSSSSVLDGYSSVLSGFNNSVISGGSYSIISGGLNNIIKSTKSLVVGGDSNIIDENSNLSLIVGGNDGYIYNSVNSSIINSHISSINNSNFGIIQGGSNNILSSNNYCNIFGDANEISGSSSDGYSSVLGGRANVINNGSNFSSILSGSGNNINQSNYSIIGGYSSTIINSERAFSFGGNNYIDSSTSSHSFGEQNTLTSVTYSSVFGNQNVSNANNSYIFGKQGSTRIVGQITNSVESFSNTGDSQYCNLILQNQGFSGAAISLQAQPGSVTFTGENDKYYEMCLRVLIINSSGAVASARFIYDILAHQSAGTLVLDESNLTLSTPNGTGWSVSISVSTNQLIIQVPASGGNNRRAIATLSWRELSR